MYHTTREHTIYRVPRTEYVQIQIQIDNLQYLTLLAYAIWTVLCVA